MKDKILIVDDEIDVCNFLKESLGFHGYEVDIAITGEEALKCLKEKVYQALFIDIRLSSAVSGIDVIKACKAMTQRPRILVISATPERYLNPTFQEEKISNVIDHVLEKPSDLKPDYLLGKLSSSLRKSQRGIR